MSSKQIKIFINGDSDIYRIAVIPIKLKISYIEKLSTIEQLIELCSDKPKLLQYIKSESDRIETQMKTYPSSVKQRSLKRSAIYFVIEKNLIDEKHIPKSHLQQEILDKFEELDNSNSIVNFLTSFRMFSL